MLFQKTKYNSVFSIIIPIAGLILGCNNKPNESKKVDIPIPVIKKTQVLSPFEISMKNQGLVNLRDLDSTLKINLKYSSTDNFFGEDVYGNLENAYLQSTPALSLKKANDDLKIENPNYRLIIYDAARPLSIQKILWEKLDSIPPKKRKDYVADPEEGSIHNYGSAVDLSVFDIDSKTAIDMGTDFDFFGELAFPRLENKMLKDGRLSKEQIDNRNLLRKVMIKNGFQPITSEWWHFNYYSRKKAKVLFQIIQ